MPPKIKTENCEKIIRLGVIGFVRGKDLLKIAAREFENIVPAAICDSNPAKKREAAELFPDTPFFNNLTEMLENARLDALIVETPADNHVKICSKALDAGVNVMSDIPCVDNIPEVKILSEAIKRNNVIYMSGANPNFRPTTEALLEVKAKGLLGKVYYIETEYIHDLRSILESSPWRKTYPPIKYCTHSLGPVLELIEEEFEWVSCFGTGSHVLNIPEQHDVMSALLRTKSNIVARLLVSFVNNYHFSTHLIRIFGTEGSAIINPPTGEFKLFSNKLNIKNSQNPNMNLDILPTLPQYRDYPGGDAHGGADYALIEKFITAIRTGSPSPLPFEKALRMALPGIYAAKSAEQNGALTKIEYPWN